MSAPRIKADAMDVPAGLAEAKGLLAEIGRLDQAVEFERQRLAERIAALKAESEAVVAPVNEIVKAHFRALQAFVQTRREEVLPKGRKSVEWATGTVGFRETPVAVRVAKGAEEELIAALRKSRLSSCVRVTEALNKEAIKENRDRIEGKPEFAGLAFASRTEFFAKPLDTEVEHVKAVPPAPIRRAKAAKAAKPTKGEKS